MPTSSQRRRVALGSLLLLGCCRASGQELRDLVEEVLDQKVTNVQIDGLPLPEALAQLGEKTGLSFVMDPEAMGCMPYGERTRVSIDLRDVVVRDGLRRMFDGLGLEMRIEGDKIGVVPGPVLQRLGRRLTVQETQLLSRLASSTWSQLGSETPPIRLGKGTHEGQEVWLKEKLGQARESNAVRQLELVTENSSVYWIPEGDGIVVYNQVWDMSRRLDRQIDLNYQRVPLDEVFIDLAKRIGVTVSFEPGVLARIQASQRTVDLVQRGTTVRQALERLCGSTGAVFNVSDSRIRIELPRDQAGVLPAGPARVVAILRLPVGEDGTTIDFPFYDDTLPPEFRRLFDRKLPEILEELRRREPR